MICELRHMRSAEGVHRMDTQREMELSEIYVQLEQESGKVVRLKSENEALMCELRHMHSAEGVHHMDTQRELELSEIYVLLEQESG